ncbi:MAG: AAA family ATPase [Opitutaceae bacterium]|nr:AAA family ATPase [Opitutaceae bacterium]
MKISRIRIPNWRNFREVDFKIPAESKLICLAGENGTGKSNLLELIAAVAARIGLAPGFHSTRGQVFQGPHEFEVTISLPDNPTHLFGEKWTELRARLNNWDGTLIYRSNVRDQNSLYLGGVADPGVANHVVAALQERKDTFYLALDSDRSYPHAGINAHELAEILTRNWESPDWGKNRAYQPTSMIYGDWIRYVLAKDAQEADAFYRASRQAAADRTTPPQFRDFFTEYANAVARILPHLKFSGADRRENTIRFDSAGTSLPFHCLSGGEREIAFLVGQIVRFNLKRGLFLIDEPELHLNPDLLRTWITYLRSTIEDGQTWIATHSLEAAECAGPSSVFVLQRRSSNGTDRTVNSVIALATLPALEALSGALGSPAFSLTKYKFIYVEGEPGDGERGRFQRLFPTATDTRFLEAGGCKEVAKRVNALSEIASTVGYGIRRGGIVDRDFLDAATIAELTTRGLLVLPVHEIENLLLEPAILTELLRRAGLSISAAALLQEEADKIAGAWIFQHCGASARMKDVDTHGLKAVACRTTWAQLEADSTKVRDDWSKHLNLDAVSQQLTDFRHAFQAGLSAYRTVRSSADLWKDCMGKEVARAVSQRLGFSAPDIYEQQAVDIWARGVAPRPTEHAAILAYLARP